MATWLLLTWYMKNKNMHSGEKEKKTNRGEKHTEEHHGLHSRYCVCQ